MNETMENAENQQTDKGVITIKKDTLWKYSTFVLLAIVVVGGFVFFMGDRDSKSPTGFAVNEQQPNQPSAPSQPSQVTANTDDDAVLGDKDAPVTIIEFSDYQCPFCARFWSQTLPQIKSEYIDTGKVKLVFRDFPLTSIHPLAQPASEAAECARDAAKGDKDEAYYKMHDKIFENQATLSVENLKKWAKELGYNIDNCLDTGKFKSEVQKDSSDAQAAGGRGTPYFVINGKALSGAQPFDAFKQVIDAELAG